jgi:hypothetical protein
VQARFQIKLHEKDRALLLLIKNYFDNIGYISKINDKSTVEFRVSDITSPWDPCGTWGSSASL